jgi:hypothetical protein
MRILITKLKRQKRKADHVKFLHQIIAELHGEIVIAALNSNIAKNKAKLLKKYNRRLKLILY